MILLKNQEIDKALWAKLQAGNLFSSPFQTNEYLDFFNSIPGLSAKVFAVEESNEILALCVVSFQKEKGIKGYFSRRAIIYGGPLIAKGEKGKLAFGVLLTAMNNELKHKVIYAETRNFNDYSKYRDVFIKSGLNYEQYLNYQILVQGKTLEDILGAMKYNRRREIQLSLKEGAYTNEAENTNEVIALYNILSALYEDRVKLPMPDLEFFIKLFNSTIGKVFIVKHNDNIIGGSFCFFYPGQSIYTMYYCGLRNYHSKIFPTHLAVLETIKFGLQNNLQKVDLMGAGKPSEEYGVRKYKSEFGGVQVEHGRFIIIFNPFLFKIGEAGLKAIKSFKK